MLNLMLLDSPVNLIVSKGYEALEDQLWNLSDALKAAARALKQRAVEGYEDLNVARCWLLNFLHARWALKRSRLSKLLKILGKILAIVMALHAVFTGAPLVVAGTIATFAIKLVSYLV